MATLTSKLNDFNSEGGKRGYFYSSPSQNAQLRSVTISFSPRGQAPGQYLGQSSQPSAHSGLLTVHHLKSSGYLMESISYSCYWSDLWPCRCKWEEVDWLYFSTPLPPSALGEWGMGGASICLGHFSPLRGSTCPGVCRTERGWDTDKYPCSGCSRALLDRLTGRPTSTAWVCSPHTRELLGGQASQTWRGNWY